MISTRSVELVIDTVVCLTLAKWETVSGQFGGYLSMSLRIAKLELCAMGTLMEPEAHLAWMRHWRRVKAEEIAAAVKAGWFSVLRADYVKAVSCKLSTRSRSRAVPS